MTPFRQPKRTAFRSSKDSATPEHRGDPLRSGVRPRPETPSPRPPDGDTPTDVTAAAAQNDGCEQTPEAPAPAHHESAVQILPFSFVVRKRKCTLFVHGRGGRGTMAVFEVKQVRTWGGGRARAAFKRDGYLKIRIVSDAPRAGFAGIGVELNGSLRLVLLFLFSGGPSTPLAGRLGSMFHQHIGLPEYRRLRPSNDVRKKQDSQSKKMPPRPDNLL